MTTPETKPTTDSADKAGGDKQPKPFTKARAAALVKRTVQVKGEDGKPVEKQVAVGADEVLAFRDYEDRVVVVTIDGQKLTGAKKATAEAA